MYGILSVEDGSEKVESQVLDMLTQMTWFYRLFSNHMYFCVIKVKCEQNKVVFVCVII